MEATIIIRDCNLSELQNANTLCYQLIGHSILFSKKDELGVLLLNSKENNNRFYDEEMEGYSNIEDYVPMQQPSFKIFEKIQNISFVDIESGDLFAALLVAFDIIRTQLEFKRYKKTKIIVFTDFKCNLNISNLEETILTLNEMNSNIIFVSNRINYVDKKLVFDEQFGKTQADLISKISNETKIYFVNYKESLFDVINSKNNSPWMWNSTLSIGSKISINISAFISLKDEFKLALKTHSTNPDMEVINTTKYFKNIEEVLLSENDLIKGYLIGSTPIAVDKDLESSSVKTTKGLQCLFFTKLSLVDKKHFSGNGSYCVLPKKYSKKSTILFNSLINYMQETELIMIAKKVFRDNVKPKMVLLLPKIIDEIPQFVMMELFFSNQFIEMHFPKLSSKKFQSSDKELNCIENFINSKMLNSNFDLKNIPNLSLNFSVNLFSKMVNEFDVIDNEHILSQWSQSNKEIIEEIKELFPLQPNKPTLENKESVEIDNQVEIVENSDAVLDYENIVKVGTVSPSENYIFLISRDVSSLNDLNLRTQIFDKYSKQLQEVIETLLFKSISVQTEKIVTAMENYKLEAEKYNASIYNSWMQELKNKIESRKMFSFWDEVVVKRSIGLITDNSDQSNFFNINKESMDSHENNNLEVDDMFIDM